MTRLTFQDAADYLNVSLDYFLKLTEEKTLRPVYDDKLDRWLVRLQDVVDYKVKRDRERHEALIRLTEMSIECGGYDMEDA